MIGLDTSHAVEYARILTSHHGAGASTFPMSVIGCLRFPSAFQAEAGQDERQRQLREWGIPLFPSLDALAAEVDGFMLEINDPTLHLRWATEAARFGKPLFIDKPLADHPQAGAAILEACQAQRVPVMSSSPLRFAPDLARACTQIAKPCQAMVYGPYNQAPAGSSIIWYGVNTAEMLTRILGRGALAVTAREDACGVVISVDYTENRRGQIELTRNSWIYGGLIRSTSETAAFTIDVSQGLHGPFCGQLAALVEFFGQGQRASPPEDALEVVAILAAADRSITEARTIPLHGRSG